VEVHMNLLMRFLLKENEIPQRISCHINLSNNRKAMINDDYSPDRIKSMCDTAIGFIIDLERLAEYHSNNTPSEGRLAISIIQEIEKLYREKYND